jgi:hypothetical protein
MADDILYRRMEMADRGGVLAFLQAAYPDNPRQSDPEFWDWHYLDHPNSAPGTIPVWLATSGSRIVGQLAAIPVELNIAGRPAPAIWILDLMVDPEFRRRGMMKKLVAEANKSYEFMLGSATRRQHSAALLTSLGWRVFSPIPRYHRMMFPGSASTTGLFRASLDTLFSPFRPAGKKLAALSENVRNVTAIDQSFDGLWAKCRGQWGNSITRSAEYLRWQFEKQPGKTFEIIAHFENQEMLGYAVLFFRKPDKNGAVSKAAISDICYHPGEAKGIIDSLIAAALKRVLDCRAGGLVTDALDPLLEERLRHFGFWPIKSGLEIMAIGPPGSDTLYDPKAWHLTRGDSDISIFEEPNV